MQNSKKITRKVHLGTDRHIDTKTGEILDIIHRKRFKVKKELKYILIMDNKQILKDLSGTELKVFLALALKAEFNEGIVYTINKVKEEIAEEIGLNSVQTVSDNISRLVEKGFLIKIEKGCYRLNEDYAWKGTKDSIEKMKNEQGEQTA